MLTDLDEIGAKSTDTNDEVFVIFGVDLRIQEIVEVSGRDLRHLTTVFEVCANESEKVHCQ